MKRVLAGFTLTLLSMGCAHLDYVGQSYPPTSNVDVVFREQELKGDYTVMGQLIATGDALVSNSKLQEKILERARKAGADAVLIESLDRVETGSTTNYQESTKNHGRHTHGTATTTVQESKRIRAQFIKYKSAH
jgi:hypothetical protein